MTYLMNELTLICIHHSKHEYYGHGYIHRLDFHCVIKVADFGLTEKMYTQNYFRQGQKSTVRLPIKWMAPESLSDGLFNEATDVVT